MGGVTLLWSTDNIKVIIILSDESGDILLWASFVRQTPKSHHDGFSWNLDVDIISQRFNKMFVTLFWALTVVRSLCQ